MSLENWVEFPSFSDERGSLVIMESTTHIPFDIKRVYYIYGARPDVARGFHAHKELKQLAICVSGHCKMILDSGSDKAEVWLDSPNKGLVVDKMIWHEMHEFSTDCILLMLANDHYDESDYIRSYDEFQKEIAS